MWIHLTSRIPIGIDAIYTNKKKKTANEIIEQKIELQINLLVKSKFNFTLMKTVLKI